MVNFDSDGAFTANKSHILDIVTLGRRDELINTFQLWREKHLAQSAEAHRLKYKLIACMGALFIEMNNEFKRKLGDDKLYTDLIELLMLDLKPPTDNEMLSIYLRMSEILDGMNLTKRDNKRYYDTTSCEAENAEKGL